MKLNKRKFTTACSVILLVFLCAFSMVIAAEKKVIYTKYDDITSYRTGTFSAPDDIPEGYVFGGWYKTDDETTPLDETDVSGEAYAKFVPEEVLGLKAQLCAELTDSNTTNDDMVGGKDIGGIRFVTSVDSKSYEDIGFYIALGDGTEESYASKKVYTTLYEKIAEDGGEKTTAYVASELFASVSTYFKTWTFYEVPSTYYRTEFTVTPYWTTLDGTVVEGSESIRTVNQGRNWNYFYVNGEGSDTTGVGTLACPYATLDDAFVEMRSCVAYQEEAGISEELPISKQIVYVNNEISMDNVVTVNDGEDIVIQTYDSAATILRATTHVDEFFNVADGGTLTLQGSVKTLTLDGNKDGMTSTVKQGFVLDKGTLNINEGAVLQNNINGTNNGGAVYVYADASLNINGGTLTGNSVTAASKHGGGVYVLGNMQMTGGSITYNTSTQYGGGISAGSTAIVVVSDGNVDYNTTTYGGGIYAANTASLTVSGGSVSHNTAAQGGGIQLASGSATVVGAEVNISGGDIKNNTANGTTNGKGGGIVLGNYRTLNVKGNAAIDNNTATFWAGGITVAGAKSILNVQGGSVSYNAVSGTATSENNYGIAGGIYAVDGSTINVSDGSICGNTAATNGGGIYASASSTLTISGGSIEKNAAPSNGGGIYACNSSKLAISGGNVDDNTATANGGGIYSTYRAYITTTGGSVSGNTAKLGGALYLAGGKDTASGYDVSLTGVTMDDNEGSTHSGGVYLGVYRKLSINKGTEIINNTSGGAGGGVYLGGASSVVEMTGGSVSGNHADSHGGGFYATNSSSLTISGGNIDRNTTDTNGGGIYATYLSDITITGGSMNSNSASSVGGGLALASGTATTTGVTADISGVTISSNTTENSHSGGVFVGSYRTMNMGEDTVISDNTSGTQGGGITLAGAGTILNMEGGRIENNTAGGGAGGGGVYISTSAVMNMTAGSITGNTISDMESQLGDGIYAVGSLNVGGSANISNMIYLNWAAEEPITVTSALTKDAYIGYIDPHDTRVRSGDVVVVNESDMDEEELLVHCGMGTNYHRLVTNNVGLALSSDAYLSLDTGDTAQIPMAGTDFWSYNDEIASVDEDGIVTANGKGNTVICFTQDGHERTYGVMVDSISTEVIDISTKELTQMVDSLVLASEKNVQQGLSLSTTGDMYVVQRWASVSMTEGDLIVNRVNQQGQVLDYMYLEDFGHGNTIAVENAEDGDYIWIGSNNDGEGYSAGVSRIPYTGIEGTMSTSATPVYTTNGDMYWNEGIFGGELQIAIDDANGLILFREGVSDENGGGDRCWIYDLKAFVELDPQSALIFRLDMPGVSIEEYETAEETQSFQGVDFAGGYVYKYIGRPNMGIYIQTFDMTGTCLHTRKVTGDDTDMLYREAEGLAIYDGKIYIGIAEGNHATNPYKSWANIFYFD